MKQYPLTSLPTLFYPDELPDDRACVQVPETLEELVAILHLASGLIQRDETRSSYLGRPSEARSEFVMHLREMALDLQREGVSPYTGVLQLALPELGHPA